MDPSKQKEEFNYAYVCALAAHAGLNRGEFRVDDDSIDVTFQAKGDFGPGRMRSPLIQIQLKCTSQDLVVDDTIKFQLSRKNYDDLRGADVVAPRYLAVLIVPENLLEWVRHNDDHVALYNSCYWLSLRDAAPTENVASVTVDVPLAQRLTSDTLRQMVDRASAGESL
jgi:hypothetical protein